MLTEQRPRILKNNLRNSHPQTHTYFNNYDLLIDAHYERRRFRWVVDTLLPLALIIISSIAVLLPETLPSDARISLFCFLLAAILWTTTSINSSYTALLVVMILVVTGVCPQDNLFEALNSSVIWLMIGAFIMGSAVEKTGLSARITGVFVGRANTVSGLFWLLTTLMTLIAFLIPSTSGRAAITIPIYEKLTDAIEEKAIHKALSILMPTIILLSTAGSLTGAGSHLYANEILFQMSQSKISYSQWLLYGLPYGVVSSYISCWVIMKMFLTKKHLKTKLTGLVIDRKKIRGAELTTIIAVAVIFLLWMTEEMHGLEIATVTMIGALFFTFPNFGVLTWKEGLKNVSWNLIIFVGAALVLGKVLISSGAVQWIIDIMFSLSGIEKVQSIFLILTFLSFISLTSHIYMSSHTARAAALIPPILYLSEVLNLNPVIVLFISIIGMDYCLTFPVSSKALLMYHELDGVTYNPSDLLKLSSVLLFVHLILIISFYYGYWQWIGLVF